MKILIVLLLSAAAVAQTPAPNTSVGGQNTAQSTSPNEDPNSRKAREMIDKAIQALGGQAFLMYQTKTEEGRSYSFYQGRPNSTGVKFWRFFKQPDKERVEMTKQRDVVYIHNGDQGYEQTYKGTAPEEPEAHEGYERRRQFTLDKVLREWIHQPGTMFFYNGTALADQKQTYKISILNAKNESVDLYLDINTFLPVRKSYTFRNPKYRDKDEESEILANYRVIQGINTPLTVTRTLNGDMTSQRFLNVVQYNVPLDDKLFTANVTFDPYKEDRNKPK